MYKDAGLRNAITVGLKPNIITLHSSMLKESQLSSLSTKNLWPATNASPRYNDAELSNSTTLIPSQLIIIRLLL